TKTFLYAQILALTLVLIPTHAMAKKTKPTARAIASISAEQDEPLSLSEMQRESRLTHARELLGKYYKHSAVRAGEDVKQINSKIYAWTKERLPKKYKAQYKKIAQTIIDESMKREFDPVFLLSVIQNESSFNPSMLGSLDEIGLMQLRPGTADWIAKKFDLKYKGAETLHDPCVNIRIGTAYMDYLRDRLPHAQLYISAYNMGKRNVDRNVEENTWPKQYASHVMRYYIEFYSSIKLVQHKKTT
ncbi:MAG: lytic transglycosylase domain-containing protein, partial [Bdellovibrionales bacterium]